MRISGDFRVEDVLTIEPCTRVELDGRVFVHDGGRIEARGSADCPVTFTSLKGSPGPGDWTYLDYEPTADNGSVFEHTIFEYGGNEHGLFAGNGEVEVAFRDVTVRHTEALGLDLRELDIVELSGAHFEDNPAHPFEIHGTDMGGIAEVTALDVQEPRILVSQGGGRAILSSDDTWSPQSIPDELTGELTFAADYVMEPGVHLMAPASARYFVRDGGTLSLLGTAEDPVILESAGDDPLPGDWEAVNFEGSSNTGRLWSHASSATGAGARSGWSTCTPTRCSRWSPSPSSGTRAATSTTEGPSPRRTPSMSPAHELQTVG